jgi:hypothetical protein
MLRIEYICQLKKLNDKNIKFFYLKTIMYNLTTLLSLVACFLQLVQTLPLDDYVHDDSDISCVKYVIKEVKSYGLYTTYRLNFTSLKWFDGSYYFFVWVKIKEIDFEVILMKTRKII